MDDRRELFQKIFAYHNLSQDTALKNIWVDDLKKFSTPQIEKAWNQFRRENVGRSAKPTSLELAKLIRRMFPYKNSAPAAAAQFDERTSDLDALVIKNMKKLKSRGWEEKIKKCTSFKEKLALGEMLLKEAS